MSTKTSELTSEAIKRYCPIKYIKIQVCKKPLFQNVKISELLIFCNTTVRTIYTQ